MATAVMWVERGHSAGTAVLAVKAPDTHTALRHTLLQSGFRWDCGALTTTGSAADLAELLVRLQSAEVELLDNAVPGDAQWLNELGVRGRRTPSRTRAAWERGRAGRRSGPGRFAGSTSGSGWAGWAQWPDCSHLPASAGDEQQQVRLRPHQGTPVMTDA